MELFFCAIPVIAKMFYDVFASWPVSWGLWLIGQVFSLPGMLWNGFILTPLLFVWSYFYLLLGIGIVLFALMMCIGGFLIALESPDYNDGYYTRRSGSCP